MSGRRLRVPVEYRSRTDIVVTVVLTVVVLVIVAGTWLLSDSRGTDHDTAGAGGAIAPADPAASVPQQLEEDWQVDSEPADSGEPVTLEGAAVARDGNRVSGLDVDTGTEAWSYERDRDLCGMTGNWRRVISVYKGPKGCGDATSVDAATGEYQDTRSALASDDVRMFRSLDSVGTLSEDRVELWRSDLVRTVEVGHVEVPVDAEAQPFDGCRFTSAQARKDLLAVMMDCGRDDGKRTVSLQEAVPEESGEPVSTHEFTVPADAELVGIAQEAAVIYVHGSGTRATDAEDFEGSRFQVLRNDGEYEQHPAEPSPLMASRAAEGDSDSLFVPSTNDLPHHMTWFDGDKLIGFGPTDLEPRFSVDALGTGAAMAGQLLVPVPDGVGVVDWSDGSVQRTIPVDRGDYDGPVHLRVQGETVIEQRGDTMVGLSQA